jgi:lincosamide nucleotidyltransferase A/C/D/E
MELAAVVELCRAFEQAGLAYIVDGGWGVDALLGEQTRPHSDLDLAVALSDLPAFEALLAERGYQRRLRDGDPDWNVFLCAPGGEAVDLHGFVLDSAGNGVLGDPAEGAMYPAGALHGEGRLGPLAVRCVAAPFVLGFRNGFNPRPVDRHDVAALCARFNLPRPSRFAGEDGRGG